MKSIMVAALVLGAATGIRPAEAAIDFSGSYVLHLHHDGGIPATTTCATLKTEQGPGGGGGFYGDYGTMVIPSSNLTGTYAVIGRAFHSLLMSSSEIWSFDGKLTDSNKLTSLTGTLFTQGNYPPLNVSQTGSFRATTTKTCTN